MRGKKSAGRGGKEGEKKRERSERSEKRSVSEASRMKNKEQQAKSGNINQSLYVDKIGQAAVQI